LRAISGKWMTIWKVSILHWRIHITFRWANFVEDRKEAIDNILWFRTRVNVLWWYWCSS
jgi:hypothetical protein